MTGTSEDSLPPNGRPESLNRRYSGTGFRSISQRKGNSSLPCFISLQEQPSLGQWKLAEETTCWSMKPGGIEPWSRAEKETSLKEEI